MAPASNVDGARHAFIDAMVRFTRRFASQLGVVAVRDVLRNIAEQRRFGQRGVNPVSGLPRGRPRSTTSSHTGSRAGS